MNKRILPWFILVCLLDFGLRFGALTFDSLYLDESYQSMYESTGQPLAPLMRLHGEALLFRFDRPHSLNEVFAHFREVDPLCPPLYGMLLNRWRLLMGSSDLALRGFSVFFSLLANISLMIFATAMFGPRIGLCTGLLQAISPFDVTYGQEVRMYSLELFLATSSMGCLMWLIQADRTRSRLIGCALYAVSTWALVNTHYTAIFTVGYQVAFALFVCWKRQDVRLLLWLTSGWLLCALLFVPWFSLFQQAASNRNGSFYVARRFTWWWPFWALIGRIPLNWAGFLSGSRVPAYLTPIYATSAVVLAVGINNAIREVWSASGKGGNESGSGGSDSGGKGSGGSGSDNGGKGSGGSGSDNGGKGSGGSGSDNGGKGSDSGESGGSDSQKATAGALPRYLVLSWVLVPPLMLWALDVIETRKVVEVARYLIATAPAAYMLGGLGLVAILRKSRLFRMVIVLHTFLALAVITYYHIVPQRRPWKEIAAAIEAVVKPNEIVMVSQYFDIVCLDRYLHRPFRQVGLSPNMGAECARKTIISLPNLQRFWLITAEDGDSIISFIPTEFQATKETRMGHDLHLYLYERKGPPGK